MPNDEPPPHLLEGLPIWVNDTDAVWPTLRIARSIPLGRLEWLWSSRGTTIRDSSTAARAVFNISNSDIEGIPDMHEQPHHWYRNPYVYLLITTVPLISQSSDAPWQKIRRFVDRCREKYHQYIVVLAASESELLQHKRVFEKLKSEVNLISRGRERLVVVPPAAIREEQRPITHLHHSPSHQDLLVRLRECVRDAVETRVQAYEEEVSRTYLTKSSPSWSFCSFFALRDAMAFVFVQLGRRDLSVKFYDELNLVMLDGNERGSGIFCDLPGADAAQGVSNPDTRDYRALLLNNTITELDLRTYLFSRQISLLLSDRKYPDVAERGLKFITVLARRCAEEAQRDENHVSTVFRDTWVFTCSRAMAALLAPAIPSQTEAAHATSTQLPTARERHTARLVAGFQVHALKAFLGLSYIVLPGCLAEEIPATSDNRNALVEEALSTSNEKLKQALSSPKTAALLYSEIANAAASLYEMGGRARGAAALDGDAGIVRLRNENYSEAENLLSAQCSRFTNDHGWDDLHKRQRVQLARAEKELDHVQEYLVSCLTMLYMSRSSRNIEKRYVYSEDERQALLKDACFWASETKQAASRLPRVMKYKVEKLFEVSVEPNNVTWHEGDPGTATVKILSDLPTSISLDYVLLECRALDASQVQKSVLHKHGGGDSPIRGLEEERTSPQASRGANVLTNASPTSATGGNSEVVIFRSNPSIEVREGVNRITVSTDEIPLSGRYKVSLVALFLENLKLVQTSGKSLSHPIVTTKGTTSSKHVSVVSSSPIHADFADGAVRFPIFFAVPRKPSGSICIQQDIPLYYAPGSIQRIGLEITAGERGIAKGSKIVCSLLDWKKKRMSLGSQILQFVDISDATMNPSKSDRIPLDMQRLDPSEDFFDYGEVALHEDIIASGTLHTEIIVRALGTNVLGEDGKRNEDHRSKTCFLHVQFFCNERDSHSEQTFTCFSETELIFATPIEVSARIESASEWGDDNVSRAVGLDGTPLGDGGTLLCSIKSQMLGDSFLTIKNITLECPSWLEQRPDEAPAHMELLPSRLCSGGVFVCAFDVLVREEEESEQYRVQLNADEASSFGAGVDRRLSRRIDNSSDISESRDDFPKWKLHRRDLSSPSGGREVENNPLETSAVIQETEEVEGIPDSSGEASGEDEEEGMHIKEASDVVDLSTPRDGLNGLSPGIMSPPSSSRSIISIVSVAKLGIELEISGLDGTICIERKISMNPLRVFKGRFRIERNIKKVGESGKPMTLDFIVRRAYRRSAAYEGSEEATPLQYEIDADPAVWLVVGQQRGTVVVSGSMAAMVSALLVPLDCGRHGVPCIRLFTRDGRGLALSRYENVNEYMQVMIMACRTIVSSCREVDADYITEETPKTTTSVGNNMPVVIASDSFFDL